MLYNGSLFGPEHPDKGFIFWAPSDNTIELWEESLKKYGGIIDGSIKYIVMAESKEEKRQHFGLRIRRGLGTLVGRYEDNGKNIIIYSDSTYEPEARQLFVDRFGIKYVPELESDKFLSNLARELLDSVKATPDHWNPMGLYQDETGNLIAYKK